MPNTRPDSSVLKVRLTQVRQRFARVAVVEGPDSTLVDPRNCPTRVTPKEERCAGKSKASDKSNLLGDVTRIHMGPPPKRCQLPTTTFPCGRIVSAAKHPMLVGLAKGRREGGPAIELPQGGRGGVVGKHLGPHRCQIPRQHTNPTTQTRPLDAIHPKEPTHEAFRGHPTPGPAAGPANLEGSCGPHSQTKRNGPCHGPSSIEPPDCRHI